MLDSGSKPERTLREFFSFRPRQTSSSLSAHDTSVDSKTTATIGRSKRSAIDLRSSNSSPPAFHLPLVKDRHFPAGRGNLSLSLPISALSSPDCLP